MQFVVVIKQDVGSRTIQIVELLGFDGPAKRPDRERKENDRKWDERVDHIHDSFFNLNALTITKTLDALIPMAASHGGTNPATAKGTATTL